MRMKVLHIAKDAYRVGQWSGGSTTELFIWPETADYTTRQFRFRVSSARVDLAESDFTPLPGVMRYITPITGGFTLTHPGKAPVILAPLDAPYRFSGEIATHCVGKATDFNLMLKGVEGEMTLCSGKTVVRPGITCLYPLGDSVFTVEKERYAVGAGELLVIFTQKTADVELGCGETIVCWVEEEV